MAEVLPIQLDVDAVEQSLLAQVGFAALRHWHDLSSEQRALIREQAIYTQIGDDISVQMAEQINALVNRYAAEV